MPVYNRQKKLRKDTGNKSVIDVRTQLCDRWRWQVRDTEWAGLDQLALGEGHLLIPTPTTD